MSEQLFPTVGLPPPPRNRDQLVVVGGVPWEAYDALARREGSGGVRIAYLDGWLEIMSPSADHELLKKMTARLLEAYAEERDIPLNGFGSETFRKKQKRGGAEPDECYFVGPRKAAPDIAIEVALSSGGVDKLEIYRRLNVPEVWYWLRDRLTVYRLEGRRYVEHERSALLPDLKLDELADAVRNADPERQTEAVRAWRKRVRRTRRPSGR